MATEAFEDPYEYGPDDGFVPEDFRITRKRRRFRWPAIPYKNRPALTAYYLGLFSLFPVLGLFLGIAAFILGKQGRRNFEENPEIGGGVHARIGIVMGGLMTILWGLANVILLFGSL